ncbi:PepSY domain-containing protein [Algoriphagus resistens]|uniref:PepSY domain-containing protein n=1 Tax=Algoriphagus resistens TaxID=1750590 RepID=UPI00071685B6|nr:PepSY domain-containing protein [Algoriphagus resistens]
MNYKTLLSFIFPFLIFSCTSSPEKQAQKLLEKSIEAHQLSENWDEVAAVKFKKVSRLLDENGAVEVEFEQWVEFRLKPYFEGKLSWEKNSVSHVANFNGSRMSYQMGENTIQNEDFLKSKRAEIDAVFFAFAQPWNRIDENASLTYEKQKTLENGYTVESVRVAYGPDSDVSWIYFDPNSGKVVAQEMLSKSHKNRIETISYDESTGLVLPKEQKSYRIDEQGEKPFLQAEYIYSGYQVTFQ